MHALAQFTRGGHPAQVHVAEIAAALSCALDLTEGQSMGHAMRSCLLGMELAKELGLTGGERAELYYALLLKDAGCSSNASRMYQILGSDERQAKREIKVSDWTRVGIETLGYLRRHVRPGRPAKERLMAILRMAVTREEQSKELIGQRCERGAYIVRKAGFSEGTAQAILNLDEHWNGKGFPEHRRGDEIPLFAQVMNLAQTLDVYHDLHGPAEALDVARRRSGRWFNPKLVEIARGWGESYPIWQRIASDAVRELVDDAAPGDCMTMDEERLDSICEAFADVIDAKSPYTFRHSIGVARAAVAIGRELGAKGAELTTLRRAALLHDIGKLSISNAILEKPGKLSDAEWEAVRRHPFYTQKILERAPVLEDFAEMAAAHHEKLDGTGYFRGMTAAELPRISRILAVSDIYDALAADRPYRKGMPVEKTLQIISEDAPDKLDADCVEALRSVVMRSAWEADTPAFVCPPGTNCSLWHEPQSIDQAVAARVF